MKPINKMRISALISLLLIGIAVGHASASPQVLSITRMDTNPTNTMTVKFSVVFSEDVMGVDVTDFTLTTSGVTPGEVSLVDVSGSSYTVTVNTGTGDGTIRLDLIDDGTITSVSDGTPLGGGFSAGEVYSIDKTPPSVAIDQDSGQNDPTNSSTINFKVVFSESVSGFTTGDVTLSGTAGATTAAVTGSGTTYNVTVTGMTQDGSITAEIAAGVSQDAAGNLNTKSTSTDNTVTYDTTPPTISGTRTPTAIADWNNVNVTVSFTCSDGNIGCPLDVILSEGKDQYVNGTTSDAAGNVGWFNVTNINIDKTKPVISYARTPGPNVNYWNNVNVSVDFTCTDALSGVSTCSPNTIVSTEGSGQYRLGQVTDIAGNIGNDQNVTNINIDKTAPTVAGAATTIPNIHNWYNHDVTVHFTASDDLSGIDILPDDKILGEGAAQTATSTTVDKAGNSASKSVSGINVDKSTPVITVSRTAANANGWNNANVVVHFTCTDILSGIDACADDKILSSEGAGQSASGGVTDLAGNSASVTMSNINIDKTVPTIIGQLSPSPNKNGWNNGNVTASFTCIDDLSGLVSCTEPKEFVHENKNMIYSGQAVDIAGNVAKSVIFPINIDRTSPKIEQSKDIVVTAAGTLTKVVIVPPNVTDNLDDHPQLINTAPKDGMFPIGDTIFSWFAGDLAGNPTGVTQKVTVLPAATPTPTPTPSPTPTPTPSPTVSPTPTPTPSPTPSPTPTPIPIIKKGDVSGDDKITIVDALFIAQYTVGKRTFDDNQRKAADVNNDGKVDIVDALFVAQYTVNLRHW